MMVLTDCMIAAFWAVGRGEEARAFEAREERLFVIVLASLVGLAADDMLGEMLEGRGSLEFSDVDRVAKDVDPTLAKCLAFGRCW